MSWKLENGSHKLKVAQPNQVWTTDMTYVWTLQGWLYVAVVIDPFSRQVVGWAMDDHMQTSLCVNALQMAFWLAASLRRMQPVCQPGISATSGGDADGAEYEPERQLLG